jgi:hypothetical protein
MSIVTTIQDIVEALPLVVGGSIYPTFIHGEKSYQNLIADEIQNVMVFLDEPITSNDTLTKGGYIEESYPLSMLFVNKTELDFTPDEHRVIIDAMRDLSKRFILRLQANSNIRTVNSSTRIDITNIFNVNLSGVILRINVVPFNSDAACVN